jgi:hypothetical protein
MEQMESNKLILWIKPLMTILDCTNTNGTKVGNDEDGDPTEDFS